MIEHLTGYRTHQQGINHAHTVRLHPLPLLNPLNDYEIINFEEVCKIHVVYNSVFDYLQ